MQAMTGAAVPPGTQMPTETIREKDDVSSNSKCLADQRQQMQRDGCMEITSGRIWVLKVVSAE
jgi:hypothetical protein